MKPRRFPFRTPLSLLVLPLLAVCSGDPATPDNPLPSLTSVSPDFLEVGTTSTTVVARGGGFVSGSRVRVNGADRPTRFVDETRLEVTLSAADVGEGGTLALVVVNGPPGGGTSGEQQVTVGYPTPTLTSMTPTLLRVDQLDGAEITVTGTGYTESTYASVAREAATVHRVSSTQATVVVPPISASFRNTPAIVEVRVFNPPPEGGPSEALILTIGNALPVLESVQPATVVRGEDARITVTGTGFQSKSKLVWNGVEQTTSVPSATSLYADVKGSDIAEAGTATVWVVAPEPGGGRSATATVTVVDPQPEITGFVPASATAGAGAFTLDIRGRHFTSESSLQWNGTTRLSTFVDSTTLRIALSALDVASPGSGSVQVVNPGTGGPSRTVGFPIVPASPTQTTMTLALQTSDLVTDPVSGLVYAAVPEDAPQHANEVVAIDPSTAEIVWSTPAGSDPARLAVNEDGTFLWVALDGATSIARIDLATHAKDLDIQLPTSSLGGLRGEDIVAIKGSPRSFAVSLRNTCCSPRHAGVAIFDDDVMRPVTTQGHTGSDRVEGSDRADRLYGYNNETTEFGFRLILVRDDGLVEEDHRTLIQGFGLDIVYDGGLVFSTSGGVIDPERLTLLGTMPVSGTVRPDVANGRVHFYNGGTLTTMHFAAFTQLGTLSVPAAQGATVMTRFGEDGLAFGGTGTVVFLRSNLIG